MFFKKYSPSFSVSFSSNPLVNSAWFSAHESFSLYLSKQTSPRVISHKVVAPNSDWSIIADLVVCKIRLKCGSLLKSGWFCACLGCQSTSDTPAFSSKLLMRLNQLAILSLMVVDQLLEATRWCSELSLMSKVDSNIYFLLWRWGVTQIIGRFLFGGS